MGLGVAQEICHFRNFETCSAERPRWGSSAFCVQNARYLPYWQGRGFDQEPVRKHPTKKTHVHR
jgi:hypothetical protein